ncbi:MAG TPA: hypothetical protein VJ890_09595 [Vineibacter sp.]|nr:hypothetical protein [Vineibacter sp.]
MVRIEHGQGPPLLFDANWAIPSLVDVGRHETGLCGFRLDDVTIPGLAGIVDLEIHDPYTGLRLYRRRPPEAVVKAKLFRLETHLTPLSALDAALDRHFQYHYAGIERLGHETAAQIFLLDCAESSYASGRLLLKSYEFYLENRGFETICMLRDPFDELAERLIVLKQVTEAESSALDERDRTLFEPGLEFVAALDLSDDRQLGRAFRSVSRADAMVFTDPLVRSLTARTPDEFARDASVASALQTLSTFAVVGLREYPDHFSESLSATLGLDPATLPVVGEVEAVVELGRRLRAIGSVKSLLEYDIEVHGQVKTALEKLL